MHTINRVGSAALRHPAPVCVSLLFKFKLACIIEAEHELVSMAEQDGIVPWVHRDWDPWAPQ